MKERILIVANNDIGLYNFRLELIETLIDSNYEVHIALPNGKRITDLVRLGCIYHGLSIDRRGKNIFKDLYTLKRISNLIDTIKPKCILSYTIKPNLYASIVAHLKNTPILVNITGLGTAVERESFLQKLILQTYRFSLKNVECVFFQNEFNRNFFQKHAIKAKKTRLIPGSGVNVNKYTLLPYPNPEIIRFVFISRILKEKGIEQYLKAAEYFKSHYSNVEFHILGACEDEYKGLLDTFIAKDIVNYHGVVLNTHQFLNDIHCLVHPSFYPEGMSNVILECASSGRPAITTDRVGCKEIIDDEQTGFICKMQDTEDLISKIEIFLKLSHKEKELMGIKARTRVESLFNRDIVIESYLSEINLIK
ncbi:MAG: glycosyltransferase family 4 protein [Tannerellaceae bacterium]